MPVEIAEGTSAGVPVGITRAIPKETLGEFHGEMPRRSLVEIHGEIYEKIPFAVEIPLSFKISLEILAEFPARIPSNIPILRKTSSGILAWISQTIAAGISTVIAPRSP